jgi:membrane fusion protein, heavy metal efflux system
MTPRSGMHLSWPAASLIAALLVGAGAAAAHFMAGGRPTRAPAPVSSTPTRVAAESNRSAMNAAAPEVRISLSKEAIERAGIRVEAVAGSASGGRVRVPAVIEANGYRSVVVTPIVAGRITGVSATLGQTVRRGEPLAEIHSPELAEAQTRYAASRAELDAHERELKRTDELAKIGAASRQDLERVHAEHAAAVTMVQSLRSRLTLLGVNDAQIARLGSGAAIGETIAVPAPIDGVITAREANVGQNVDAGSKLFTVVDLSTVWAVGDLYERDFSSVHVGSLASVTTTAYPDLTLEGKVTYIDPQVRPETRTAQIRVELPNHGRRLRPGMYAEMQVGVGAAGGALVIMRSAVQVIADKSVVYLADPSKPGDFVEREVRLGSTRDKVVEVLSGLHTGDRVVVDGAFALRAERERLGIGASAAISPAPSTNSTERSTPSANRQTARISVTEKGYEPARVMLKADVPARLTFIRTTDATCGTEVTIPSLNVKRALPLNQVIDIDFTPSRTGDVEFVCGMGMLRGTIVVQ